MSKVTCVDEEVLIDESQQQPNKVVPTKNEPLAAITEKISTRSDTLASPNWDLWRKRGACRIWKAVLISMGIKPVPKVRTKLRLEQPWRYKEYRDRKKDVIAQYGFDPLLPDVPHASAGKNKADKYVLLTNLLQFAQKYQWENLEAFEQGMKIPCGDAGTGNTTNFSFEALPEETRNGLVRTGALLKLLEDVLLKRDTTNTAKFLHGEKLNISTVAERVEKIIGVAAGQEKVKNFAREANRRYLAKAQNSLRSNG